MNRDLAPVVLFVYNRLEHMKKTVEALQKNILAKDSKLFIFSDGLICLGEHNPIYEIFAKTVNTVFFRREDIKQI